LPFESVLHEFAGNVFEQRLGYFPTGLPPKNCTN
jgi:hypothetical protein